jgi:phenylalanyl-tRNA synthetase alpha chain
MLQNDLLQQIKQDVSQSLAKGEAPETIRLRVLGRKGSLTQILRDLSKLSLEEKKTFGQAANQLRQEIESQLETYSQTKKYQSLQNIDTSVPAYPPTFGSIHPVSAMIEEVVKLLGELAFEVIEGSEIVSENENFESLNMSKDHPARDGQDSFYLDEKFLMRTQTSAIQVAEISRRVKAGQMPIRLVAPGKTYRRESDMTHSAMFHQFEGIVIDNQTTFSDLNGTLDYLVKRIFGNEVETRFRPHYFPFTEPSAEIDIRWKGQQIGEGKHTGWLEFGGCGMMHPKVLQRAGINPKIHQGWAFGMSVERPIMIRNQVPDLRLFFHNSIPFLQQFPD